MQYMHSYGQTCIHHIHLYSPHSAINTVTTHIDTLSNLCLTYGYEASLHSRHVVGSDEVYLSVVFFSIIWEPAAWHCAWFFASTDAKDLCLVWSFKFLFSAGSKPKQICSRDTSQDISDRSTLMCYDFMTFMISLRLAKIWGRFPHVCVDEDYLALKRISSWSLQCCCKSTIWKMPWYLNSKNCTQSETDLPDSATLFASHGIGSVGSDICIHMSCMYCVFCHAQLRVFCIRRCSKEDDAEEQGRAQFALRSQLLRHCRWSGEFVTRNATIARSQLRLW